VPGVAAVRLLAVVLRAGVVPLSMRGSIDCRVRGTLRTGLAAESVGLGAPFVLSWIRTGPSLLMLWRRPAAVGAEVPCPAPPLLSLLLLPGLLGGALSGTPPIVWRRSPERGGGPRFRVDIKAWRAVLTHNSQSANTCLHTMVVEGIRHTRPRCPFPLDSVSIFECV
jgi:hypothetical protein